MLGDLDGDKVPDAISVTSSQVFTLHGDKTGAFEAWSSNLTTDTVALDLTVVAALADLNRDGKLDLVEADGHTTRVFLQE